MNGARKSSLKLWADGELDTQKPEDRDSAAGYDAVVSAEPDSVMKTRGRSASQIPIIFVTVFLTYTVMTVMNPLIAPLSRVIGMPEWQIGVGVSVAALCVAVASPFWGRLSQRVGARLILISTICSATLAMVVFAAVAHAGFLGIASAGVVFVVLLLVRGVWFGLSEAAVLPTAQAYVASITPDPTERVRGMAAIGAGVGASSIAGAIIGGLLGGISLPVALWAVPILLVLTLAIVTIWMKRTSVPVQEEPPRKVSATDSRVRPYLIVSFGQYTALGFIQILVGFLVQDRLFLGTEQAVLVTGIAFVCAGVGLLLSQAIAVTRLRWQPVRYIRVGAVISAIGILFLVPDWGASSVLVAMFITGVGIGMATPGVAAGVSLAVGSSEQGSVAGLVAATNALTFIIAPTAATALYALSPLVPLIAAAIATVLVMTFSPTNRRLAVTPESVHDDEARI